MDPQFFEPIRSFRNMGDHVKVTVRPPPNSGFSCEYCVLMRHDQFDRYQIWVERGGLIEDWLPELNADEHEGLLSGITPRAWKEAFGGEDDA